MDCYVLKNIKELICVRLMNVLLFVSGLKIYKKFKFLSIIVDIVLDCFLKLKPILSLLFICTVLSCTESISLVDPSMEVGLIVECELADDRSVRATIYYAGNTSGKKPSLIVPDDSLNFYMGLANLDVGHKFVQDEMEKEKYSVSSELLQIEPGKAYRFYGERYTESLFSKVLRVPQRLLMDSFHIKEIKTEVDNFIVLDCNIFLLGDPRQLQFLYIRAEGINDEPIEYEFDENSHIYRVLNHRKGFLAYNQVQAFPNLKFKLKLPSDYSHKKIKLITGHTTDTYYYHNLYLSNSFGSTINQQNPPIYPSNINTTNANGIFSAASFSEHVLDIR